MPDLTSLAADLADQLVKSLTKQLADTAVSTAEQISQDVLDVILKVINAANTAEPEKAKTDGFCHFTRPTATAGELITFLQLFDRDKPVTISTLDGGGWLNIDGATNPRATDEPSIILMPRDDHDTRQY